MEDIAPGVTPEVSLVPEGDPFIQQLLAENERLIDRIQVLERRLKRYEDAYNKIAAIVQNHSGEKGVQG